jgi:hypothetical protein
MKKALLLTGLLLVLSASLAMAAGYNITWGTACGSTPVSLMTFACASNTTPANWRWTTSFKLDADIEDYINFDTYVEGVFEAGLIPDWWKLSITTDCRGATTNSWAHTSATPGSCVDPFEGTATGGGGYGYLTTSQVQIEAVYTVATGVHVTAGDEVYMSTFAFKNYKTVGTPKCDGCAGGAVFGLLKALIGREFAPVPNNVIKLQDPFEGGNACLRWQHGWTGQPCNPPVPVRNTTWGQVKSLYR